MTEPTSEHIKEYIEQKAEGRLGAFESSLYDELVKNMSINTGNLLKKYVHLKKTDNIVDYL